MTIQHLTKTMIGGIKVGKSMKTKRLSIKILTAFAVVAMIIAGIFAIYGASNTVKADTLAFEMVSGASLRVNEEGGIRFRAKMDQTKYEQITKNENVTLAFIIAPAEHFAHIDSDNETKGKYYETLSIGNRATIVNVDESLIYAEDGSYYANGCVVGVKESNRKLIYASIAVIITDNGETDSYEYAGIDGKTVNMEGFSFDLARAQFYDLINQATLDTKNDYTGAIFANESFDWYGTEAYPISIKDIQAFDQLVTKVNAGYTFEGKYILVDSSVDVNEASVELNAGLTMPEYKTLYTVTFKAVDGTVLETKTAISGSAVTYTAETPVKAEDESATYTFDKWVLTVEGAEDATEALANVNGNLVVYPSFTANAKSYDVTFVNYDGSELDVISVKYGEVPEYVGETPTRAPEGENVYEFAGWTPELVEVTGATTYTAKFDTLAPYVVSSSQAIGFTYVDSNSSAEDQAKLPDGSDRGYLAHWDSFASGSEIKNTLRGNFEAGKTYEFTISINVVEFTPDTWWWIDQFIDGTKTPDLLGWSQGTSCTIKTSKTFNESLTEATINYRVARDAFQGQSFTLAINVEWKEVKAYTITWVNYDGSVLETDTVAEGEVPVYNGATPTRPANGSTTYTFGAWSPAISAATTDATYTATYLAERPYMVTTNLPTNITYIDSTSSAEEQAKLPAGATEGYSVALLNNTNGDFTISNQQKYDFKAGVSYKFTISTNFITMTPGAGYPAYDVLVNGEAQDTVEQWKGNAYSYNVIIKFTEDASYYTIPLRYKNGNGFADFNVVVSCSFETILPYNASTTETRISINERIDANSAAEKQAYLPEGCDYGYYFGVSEVAYSNLSITNRVEDTFEAGKTYAFTVKIYLVSGSTWYNCYVDDASIFGSNTDMSVATWNGRDYSYTYNVTFEEAADVHTSVLRFNNNNGLNSMSFVVCYDWAEVTA